MTNKLTVEKMDRINFLLTEVSLECLGNRFFDIYGDQSDTLLQLVSVDSLKPKDVNADFRTALWDALGMEKTAVRVADQVHIAKPLARKRRASFSGQNETDDNDPESLLVPMQKAPEPFALPTAPAKVNRRRFTVNVSQLQKQTLKMLSPDKSPKVKAGSVQDIVEHLRNDIKSKIIHMQAVSQMKEEQQQMEEETEDIETFFTDEEKSLLAQSNTLIQFIKFLQTDGDNGARLRKLSKAILILQSEF